MNLLFGVYGLCDITFLTRFQTRKYWAAFYEFGKEDDLMSIQEVAPEQLAELFHHYHQALEPDCHSQSTRPSATWEHVLAREKSRLIAAARLALLELTASAREQESSRRYFAKPGDAEWGC